MIMQRKSRFLRKHANSRSGQAALEFIMTYGWAILVVLIAIAALAYFGVLSSSQFLPSKCTLQPGIACLDHKATPTTMAVQIQNSLGSDITISRLTATNCPEITPSTTPALSPTLLPNGAGASYTFGTGATTCTNSGSSKYTGQFNITYTASGSTFSHINQGEITSKIE